MAKNKYPHFNPEKYKLDVKIASVKKSFHCTYNINYHIIWIPKYRKALLMGKVADVLRTIINGQCQQNSWQNLALEIMPDHIHLFLSAKPSWKPSQITQILRELELTPDAVSKDITYGQVEKYRTVLGKHGVAPHQLNLNRGVYRINDVRIMVKFYNNPQKRLKK